MQYNTKHMPEQKTTLRRLLPQRGDRMPLHAQDVKNNTQREYEQQTRAIQYGANNFLLFLKNELKDLPKSFFQAKKKRNKGIRKQQNIYQKVKSALNAPAIIEEGSAIKTLVDQQVYFRKAKRALERKGVLKYVKESQRDKLLDMIKMVDTPKYNTTFIEKEIGKKNVMKLGELEEYKHGGLVRKIETLDKITQEKKELNISPELVYGMVREGVDYKAPFFREYPNYLVQILTVVITEIIDEKTGERFEKKEYSTQYLPILSRVIDYPVISRSVKQMKEKYESSGRELKVDNIKIYFIPATVGGCYINPKFKHDYKAMQFDGDIKVLNPKSSENNCYFYCFKPEYKEKYKEKYKNFTKGMCNMLRRKHGCQKGRMLTATECKNIHKKEFGKTLTILNLADIKVSNDYDPNHVIICIDKHYMRFHSQKKPCPYCGTIYGKEHSEQSCLEKILLHNKKRIDGVKYVVPRRLRPKMWDGENEMHYTLHYDIETWNPPNKSNAEPYLVGYSYCIREEPNTILYEVIEGENCMDEFVSRLRKNKELSHIEFINAFNGSNFDHYFLIKSMKNNKELSLSDMQIIKANGSIIHGIVPKYTEQELKEINTKLKLEKKKAMVNPGPKLVDIGRLLGPGGLSDHLVDYKCKIQKGEFIHEDVTNGWEGMTNELQKECLKYLDSDVLGLMELSEKYHKTLMDHFETSWVHFFSASQLTYGIWCNTMREHQKKEEHKITIPNLEQYEFIRQSIYGGCTLVYRKKFISDQYYNIMKLKNPTQKDYDNITDYLVALDVVSLYPASMIEDFGVGPLIKTNKYQPGKIGYYRVKYKANNKLLSTALPSRDELGNLSWDVRDGEGVYCSVDIETAKAQGYKFQILEGYYHPKKYPVFEKYIKELFQKKSKEKKKNGKTSYYLLCKLMMNGLYGKTIQRPIFSRTSFIKNGADWDKIAKHEIVSIDCDSFDDTWVVKTRLRDPIKKEKKITKPAQFGSAILAYSRRIMHQYEMKLNPSQDPTKHPYYKDTDSLFTHIDQVKRSGIEEGNKLGDVDNDIGAGAKIIFGMWIAPKMYYCKYIIYDKKQGKYVIKEKKVGKGVKKVKKKNPLTEKQYEEMSNEKPIPIINKKVFKKNFTTLNKTQVKNGIDCFSVSIIDVEKKLNKNPWRGRYFDKAGDSVPYGHVSLPSSCSGAICVRTRAK